VKTAFEYLYRDAGNFKAFGEVLLEGELKPVEQQLIRDRLFSGEFFIAEQVGVPPLYRQLYEWSGGPTKDDRCWHEFVGFRQITETNSESPKMSSTDFVARFADVEAWCGTLSPHFWIEEGS
jgi:hypothetical protein